MDSFALHRYADALIAVACGVIAVALLRLALTRRVVFPSVFILFGAFAAATGLPHAFAAFSPAAPTAWLTTGLMLCAGVVTLVTALAIWHAMPQLLQMPTRAELEARVVLRTAELTAINEQLQREGAQREQAQFDVRRLNSELQARLVEAESQKDAEKKRLDFERKLLQSQKLESIGVLAGGIAHDFNNLLTGVMGHANFARTELARGNTNVDAMLAQVETSAQRAADLCRQLLAYAGKGRFVVRMIDLNAAVEQAVPLLNLSITKKVTLELQLGPGLPPFRGDPTQMNQVLMNLVANASEAIGTAVGKVTIRTERVNLTPMDMLTLTAGPEVEPGAFVLLEVRDTGSGISPEALPHIFEPFFTTKFIGRGLGLAAVLGIIQGHRGAIRVSSQPGAGSNFEIFLPIVTTAERTTPSPFAPQSRGTVLVVDDEETIREFAGRVLTNAGYAVVSATDGEDALTRLRRDPVQFDAVLLDLTMPKLDGEDTLMALRMLAPALPVVLTSGYSEQTVVQRFVGRGLADFLPKPFLGETLVSMVGAAVARARGSN